MSWLAHYRGSRLCRILGNMNHSVALINASIKHGQKYSGVETAPKFFKEFGLYNELYKHFENVRNYFIREDVDLCYQDLHKVTLKAIEQNDFSLIVGGDHSISLSTIPALLEKHPDLKILWIDAHADMNTPETSPSGHLHGMPLAALSGLFEAQKSFADFQWIQRHVKPENIILLGTRDVDAGEKEFMQKHPFHVFSYTDVQRMGLKETLVLIQNIVGKSPLHVSFDVDSINPLLAPSTGVPVASGFNLQDVTYMGSLLGQLNTVSLELVEFNPQLGNTFEAEITANALIYLLRSFLRSHTSRITEISAAISF